MAYEADPDCGFVFTAAGYRDLFAGLTEVNGPAWPGRVPKDLPIFVVAGEEYHRSSPFFEENIRNYEYEAIVDLALESLDYADLCLINAPFTREVRDVEYMRALRRRLQKKDARLVVVWVKTDPEVVHQRMIQRNSDRDIWKLQHWDAYNAGVNYEIPECLNDPTVTDEFYVVSNNSDEELRASMRMLETMLRR